MYRVEPLFTQRVEHGEGPVWDPEASTLYWVDLLQGKFYRASAHTGTQSEFAVGQPLGVLALREKGGLVMALRDGFAFWDAQTRALTFLHDPEAHLPSNRFNDGAVDPAGRFLAGTMAYEGDQAVGNLYVLDYDRRVRRLEAALFVTNGMDWSPDGRTFYLTDTGRHLIYAYDYDPEKGILTNRRVHIRFNSQEFPDGMRVDAEGGCWVALWGGGLIRRFDWRGQKVADIPLPVSHPTSCCFGGDKRDELFITTSQLPLPEAERKAQPLAGCVLHVQTDVQGQLQRRYRG
jgi:sugar lactone lactonase YvrE